MSKGKILFQLSGSIACFKACQLISRLVQAGYELEVVATPAALEFVGEATLEGLTGRKVHTALFAPGEYMNHIRLIRWADLALLCPASANSVAKLANGTGDDLVSTLFLAHDFKKPYLIAPAMNAMMMNHPATQAALARLRSWGVEVLGSGEGALACGEIGEGRLLEPEDLFRLIEARLQPASGLEILVTSGGTREPIDGVRAIVNSSTGATGAALAAEFARLGHRVTLLRARDAVAASSVRERTFVSFQDLRESLREELGSGRYQAVVHAAAVSDYSVAQIEADGREFAAGVDKIDSSGALTLRLKRNPKLVDDLRTFADNPKLKVVAFKLTNTENRDERGHAVAQLADHAKPDWIVQNDLSEIRADQHPARVYEVRDGSPAEIAAVASKVDLARTISKFLQGERS